MMVTGRKAVFIFYSFGQYNDMHLFMAFRALGHLALYYKYENVLRF